jgi:hypothetical protein
MGEWRVGYEAPSHRAALLGVAGVIASVGIFGRLRRIAAGEPRIHAARPSAQPRDSRHMSSYSVVCRLPR